MDALLGGRLAVAGDFHVDVLEVLALNAVGQHITQGGVGVDQLDELQGLQGMGGGSGDTGHGTQSGLGGQHGLTIGGHHHVGAAALAPAGGGGGPALGKAHATHTGGLVGGGGVGVDEAGLHPLLHDLELIHHVGLLIHGHDLVAAVAVADAQGGQADTHLVIAVLGDGGDAVLVQQQRRLAGAVLQSLQSGGGVLHGVDVGVVGVVGLNLLLGPDKELLGGVVLIGGDAVDLAVDLGGVQELGGNGLGDARALVEQVGDVQERAHLHVVGVGAGVGEHDVIGLVGLHDNGPAVAPVAPGDALDVQMHADLFLQIGVDLLGPGAHIGRLAAAHLVPGDDGDAVLFSGRGRGVVAAVSGCAGVVAGGRGGAALTGTAVAAAGQQAQSHNNSQEQSKILLHVMFSSL